MAEEVETGGLMRFRYTGEQAKLADKDKKEIERAYQQADERKRKEKARRRAFWIIGSIIAILLISITIYASLR